MTYTPYFSNPFDAENIVPTSGSYGISLLDQSDSLGYVIFGHSGNYVYAYKASTGSVILRKINYVELTVDSFTVDMYPEDIFFGYVPVSDSIGIALISRTLGGGLWGVVFFTLNWNTSAQTQRAVYSWTASAKTLGTMLAFYYNNEVRIVLTLNKTTAAGNAVDLVTFKSTGNSTMLSEGPADPADDYNVTPYNVSYFEHTGPIYADLGNGTVGLYMRKGGSASPLNAYVCLLNTDDGSTQFEPLPSWISEPIEWGNFWYDTPDGHIDVQLCPKPDDNSMYIQMIYWEQGEYDPHASVKIMRISSGNGFDDIIQFGTDPWNIAHPIELMFSKNKVISCVRVDDGSTDVYIFYDVTNSVELFRMSGPTNVDRFVPAVALDDNDNQMIWTAKTPERNTNIYVDLSTVEVIGETDGVVYPSAWEELLWDATTPNANYGQHDIAGSLSESIQLIAKVDKYPFATGSQVTSVTQQSNSNTKTVITGLTVGSMYEIQPANTFIWDTTKSPTTNATIMYFDDGYLDTQIEGAGNVGQGNDRTVYYGMTTYGRLIHRSDCGTFQLDGMDAPRTFFTAGSDPIDVAAGSFVIGERAKHSGTVTFNIYNASTNYYELAMNLGLPAYKVSGSEIIHIHFFKTNTGANPYTTFARLYFDDETYVEQTWSSTSWGYHAFDWTITSGSGGANKFLDHICIGFYMDDKFGRYDVNLLVTELGITLTDSIAVIKVASNGDRSIVVPLGDMPLPIWTRLCNSIIDTGGETTNPYMIVYWESPLPPEITGRFQAIFWN